MLDVPALEQEVLRFWEENQIERLYLEPLATLDPTTLGRLPRFLLLDAADEAETTNIRPSIAEMFAQTVELFPPWLRLYPISAEHKQPGRWFPHRR